MRDLDDAHGRLMYEFLKGREVYEIIERDDGFFGALAVAGYFSPYKKWSINHKRSMRYVSGRVLDIGCGAGRHSLYLQKKGFDVLGIDLSPLAVKVSKLRGVRRVRVMSITGIGPQLGRFDTLLMIGNNFGLFQSFTTARRLLRRFNAITSGKARIIVETRDPYKTTDPFHLQYHRLNRSRGRLPGQVRMRVRHRKYATPWFDYLLVSRNEMKKILTGTGWRVRRFIGSGVQYVAILEKAS